MMTSETTFPFLICSFILASLYRSNVVLSSSSACLPPNGIIANGNTQSRVYNDFTFVSRAEWQASNWRNDICSCNATASNEMIAMDDPYVITIHHTAIPTQSTSLSDSISKLRMIQYYHQYNHSWCDIAYNFLVDSAGHIFQGRAFWDDNETLVNPLNMTRKWNIPRLVQGSHSLNHNTNNIGIAVIGCYDDNVENCPAGADAFQRYDVTYTRLVQLISWLAGYYDIAPSNDTIVRHKHWRPTECPGNVLGALVDDIIVDVQGTVDDGTALCYNFANTSLSNKGGRCMNAMLCRGDDMVMDTKDEDQCVLLGQTCCDTMSDHGNAKKLSIIYVLIGVLSVIASCAIVGLVVFFVHRRKMQRNVNMHVQPPLYQLENMNKANE